MRSAKYFHSEGDYVATRSFLVAMAIGAIASGQVVFSLVNVRIDPSVAAQTLVAAAQALIHGPEATQLPAQPLIESTINSGADNRLDAAVNESSTDPKGVEPAIIANPLAEASPNDDSVKVVTPPSVAAASGANKTAKIAALCATGSRELRVEAMALGTGAEARLTCSNGIHRLASSRSSTTRSMRSNCMERGPRGISPPLPRGPAVGMFGTSGSATFLGQTSQVLGTPRLCEPRAPLARAGQGAGSARTVGSGLWVVYRGV